jgi:hypothetical protein
LTLSVTTTTSLAALLIWAGGPIWLTQVVGVVAPSFREVIDTA